MQVSENPTASATQQNELQAQNAQTANRTKHLLSYIAGLSLPFLCNMNCLHFLLSSQRM
jgi:hypothetical protein